MAENSSNTPIKTLPESVVSLNEIFYYHHLNSPGTSWVLTHPELKYEKGSETAGTALEIRGIMTEEESGFSIRNEYGQGSQDAFSKNVTSKFKDMFESFHNNAAALNTMGQVPGMMRRVEDKLNNIDMRQYLGDGAAGYMGNLAKDGANILAQGTSSVMEQMNKAYNTRFDFLGGETIKTIANSQFMSAADQLRVFNGSTAATLIPRLSTIWLYDGVSSKKARSITNVKGRVRRLLDVCMGDLNSLADVAGYLTSPGGYAPDIAQFKPVDYNGESVVMPSHYKELLNTTWTLKYGKDENDYRFKITGLLMQGIEVRFSKYNAMNYDGSDSGQPLYAELSFDLIPATFISKHDLAAFFNLGD